MSSTRLLAILAFALMATPLGAPPASRAVTPAPQLRILVFSKTTGFRHGSIPTATRALRELGARNRIAVEATEDASAFTDSNLRRFDAVVFLLTTGDVLDERQQAAFERYIRAGGGFAGVHSATDTESGWPWYGRLVGASFRTHPEIQRAAVTVTDGRHPSTVDLPRRWVRTDEWYAFRRNPRGAVHVLATLDESSYRPGDGSMGGDHPIAWSHPFEGGRAWYTGGGHTDEAYGEPLFRAHLLGGIRWAAGLDSPRIRSLSAAVQRRRLVVTFRATGCRRCEATLTVRDTSRTTAPTAGTVRLTSEELQRGRWDYTVVLLDRATGLKDRVHGAIRVS